MAVATLSLLFVLPVQAFAIEIESYTAKANEDGGTSIIGGVDTRVTIDLRFGEGEDIQSFVLDMPLGSSFDPDNVVVTGLFELERVDLDETVTAEGSSGFKVELPEVAPDEIMIKVEVHGISLPSEGGTFGITGTYTTSTGETFTLPPTDQTITVVGVTMSKELASWIGEQPWFETWTDVKFLRIFMNPQVAVTAIPSIVKGWLMALGLVAASFPLAIPVGLAFAFLRMSKNRLLRGVGSLYINIIRGTPLFLQIYIAFFGLPLLNVSLPGVVVAICVLLFNSSAYLAEIFRAGIQSIPKGQFEASRSLGMTGVQTMFSIIIPQTFRRVIPTMTSEFILLYKDTSLLAAVGVAELMTFAKSSVANTGNMTPYIVIAGFYLIVTLPMTKLINILEERLADKQGGTGKKKKKKQIEEPVQAGAEA